MGGCSLHVRTQEPMLACLRRAPPGPRVCLLRAARPRQNTRRMGSLATGAVPPWLVGMWERRYIRSASTPFAPDDIDQLEPEDSATTVRYLQTPRLFCDIRLPADRAGAALPAGGLEATSAEALEGMLAGRRGQAFAGLAEVWRRDDKEERVHWHAAFNFSPPNDAASLWPQIDAGRHTTEDIGRVEHKEHGSRWWEWGTKRSTFVEARAPHPSPHATSSWLVRAEGRALLQEWVKIDNGASGHLALRRPGNMLLVLGDWFAFVADPRTALESESDARPSIAGVLGDAALSLEEKRSVVGAEYSCGRVSAGWRIEGSTLPWREGEALPIAELVASGGWERVSGEGIADAAALLELGKAGGSL